jgi:fumarate hydratase subunit alpha
LCQDTGLPIVFIEIGENVFIKGSLKDAVIKGAKAAYKENAFRQSVVSDPVLRKPPFKCGPALLEIASVKGQNVRLTVMAKGFGSENKTKLKMMNPTAGISEIEEFVVNCIKDAGADACPPYIVGVGIGGVAETANLLAKKALLLPIDHKNKQKHLALMEKEIFKKINDLKIGVMGLGGGVTCLQVSILTSPTHIAGLPVAVNIGCHATRSASCKI